MKNNYLKLRTIIIIAVIAVFAAAIHPLTPRDFYKTFRGTIQKGQEQQADALIADAMRRQEARSDQYPSVALLEAADASGADLRAMTEFKKAADNSEVIARLRKEAASSIRLGLDLNGGVEFVLNLNPDYDALASGGLSRAEAEKKLNANFNQYRDLAMEALRKRLESQNIFETEIAPFGRYGLSLKAPIVSKDEKDKLQKLIQASSKLQFRLVHPDSDSLIGARPPHGYEVLAAAGRSGEKEQPFLVSKIAEMDGNGVDQAFVSRNQVGQISVALHFTADGAKKFAKITAANIGRQLAIVLDGTLYCAPVIRSEIAEGRAEISGHFSMEEAQNIADALTNGSFPFQIGVEAVYDTAPTLGADNVRNGIWAGLLALGILAVFMTVYYRWAGLIACTALAVNVVLILGAMAAFGATMTMPGIAGIILTLGMAVDANVLVFERMREENELGKDPVSVVSLGFQKAYSSVVDSNLTTLVVAVILMYFGTGAVKGFAVSLSIGIVASLFTALFMTHVIFDWLIRFIPQKRFHMMKFFSKPNINFLKQSRIAIPVSLVAIVLSLAAFFWKGTDMLGVEFTGGTMLSYQYAESVPVSQLEQALAASGIAGKVTYKSNASSADNKKMEILIRRGFSVENDGIGAKLNAEFPQLKLTDGHSSVVGGMVGTEMTKNAIMSIVLAFVGMIIYVTFRYEFSYAVAGILALIHDVIIATGIFVLMGRELSLPVVAGVLTIIGYSINDTIVIFDRIREELHLHPDRKFTEVVNESLNRTLSRTILTSLTTFLVVTIMFMFGGIAINDFVLIIMMGIVIGTYSSIFIASPLVVAWRNYRSGKGKQGRLCSKTS